MLTIARLVELRLLRAWVPRGNRLASRCLYYSQNWVAGVNALQGARRGGSIAAWDPATLSQSDANDASDLPDIDLISLDLSVQGRVAGLAEGFVTGEPRKRLVRKEGFGMDPPFRRMRAPYSAVVEMRTSHTRTFGFFARVAVFVAHRIDLADNTHADPTLYQRHATDVLALMARVHPGDRDEIADIESLIGEGTPNE